MVPYGAEEVSGKDDQIAVECAQRQDDGESIRYKQGAALGGRRGVRDEGAEAGEIWAGGAEQEMLLLLLLLTFHVPTVLGFFGNFLWTWWLAGCCVHFWTWWLAR